ncbi:hypothetical protein N9J26_00335 [bacterium]|nr:hypothetical protein [bacterium]
MPIQKARSMAPNDCLYLLDALRLPEQTLDKLSFSSHKPARLIDWAETLPLTNVNQCSVILYKAMPEICLLKATAELRFELLEIMRPLIDQCTRHLAGEFLNQPVIMPEKIMKMAVIAQSLQRHLNEGYMLCVQQWLKSGKKIPPQPLCDALYRAINGTSLRLLRSYQLYLPRPPGFWRRLHNLYQLSLDLGLSDCPVKDSLLKQHASSTCEMAYLRTLVLAASGTNQLRQNDLQALYDGLESWSRMVKMESIFSQEEDHLFWVMVDSDEGPFYKHRLKGAPDPSTMALDFSVLLNSLSQETIHMPLKPSLMNQVAEHWQKNLRRSEERHNTNNIVDICPGLTTVHRMLLGNQTFEEFLQNRLDPDEVDWGGDPNQGLKPAPVSNPTATAITSDVSDRGLCLQWAKDIPAGIKVGEAIGIRNSGQADWQLGIVRWVRRHHQLGYAGVLLLSDAVQPSAASTTFEDGTNSPYFRTLLFDNSTLVTPAVPFSSGQKVRIRHMGQQSRATLSHMTLSSGTISLFSIQAIRTIEHLGDRQVYD